MTHVKRSKNFKIAKIINNPREVSNSINQPPIFQSVLAESIKITKAPKSFLKKLMGK